MKPQRLLLGLLLVGLLGGALLFLRQTPPSSHSLWPGCLFHKFTGLHCPGCGMTRATYLLTHGQIWEAFRMNPFGMIALPLALLAGAYSFLNWCSPEKKLPTLFKQPICLAGVVAFVAISFTILRNIPHRPFNLLAPQSLEMTPGKEKAPAPL